jgi:peptidylprolyl isomerase
MRLASALLLTVIPATFAYSQTPTVKKPVVHHTATTAAASTLPPNIPKVPGIAKPLYALKYIDAVVGTGPLAEPTVLGTSQADSKVMFYTVKYTGWLAKDGTKFDSSYDHPGAEPFTFPYGVRRVVSGWDTGFTGMHIGGKRRLFIPWQLAYGASGHPPVIPPNSDLIFDIELVSVSDKPPAPPTPPTPPAQQPQTAPAATPPDSAPKPQANPQDR